MTTKVWVTEEYGYREWLWLHPGDVDDVVADWKAGRTPSCVHVYRYDGQGPCLMAQFVEKVEAERDLSDEERLCRAKEALEALWLPQTGDFAGTCQLWVPRLPHWQKLESDAAGRDESDPDLHAALELYTRLTQRDELCRAHGIVVTAHCHEWEDTSLHAMGVRYPAWWEPQPWERERAAERVSVDLVDGRMPLAED